LSFGTVSLAMSAAVNVATSAAVNDILRSLHTRAKAPV
jgi:hypothetical protein